MAAVAERTRPKHRSREPDLQSRQQGSLGFPRLSEEHQQRWRNPTMHVECDYDEEQAFDILCNAKNFMLHVARRLKISQGQ
jgi:hypothetical protein